jgi:hypothetical protein
MSNFEVSQNNDSYYFSCSVFLVRLFDIQSVSSLTFYGKKQQY